MTWVGTSQRPLDWQARTDGTLAFTADLIGPDTLHAAVLRSPHPHAEIVSIDVGPALRMPGVVSVITADDFPDGITYLHRGFPLSDRPPLAAGVVRHVGQEVAAVAATTRAEADMACREIRVRYRIRPAALTVGAALSPGASTLHERTTGQANVSVLFQTDWGDVEAGLAAGHTSVDGRFAYPSVSHACMETNTTLASWNSSRHAVELWTSTQAPWFIAKEVSHLLEIEHDDVVIREVAVGGGFGSKSKCSEHEVLAAALSRKAGRPVLLQLSRREELGYNKPRHRFETQLRTTADAHGVVRAYETDIVVDNGSYNHMGSSVMRVGAITLGSLYRPIGVRIRARLVDTATQPGGQFRGYGTPQVSLATESQLDELAEQLGLDPIDLRLRNVGPAYAETLSGYRVTTTRLAECLDAVREGLAWDEHKLTPQPHRGVGVASAMHGSGAYAYDLANRSDAAVDVDIDGRVRVRYGGADAGTGQSTILAQIAADELGVDLSRVSVLSMDSERTPFELGAWSSRGTHMTGSSVGLASREMADRLRALAAEKLGTEDVVLREGKARSPQGDLDIGDLVALHPDTVDGELSHETTYLLGTTEPLVPTRSTANLSPTYSYAAHGALVDVDPRTGKVQVLDYVAAHDVGAAINPVAVRSQIIGGAAMGLGAALGEESVREGGRIVNTSYLHYAMPRSADLPSVRAQIIDSHDDAGPYGAKSVGETSIIPPGAAVANAVYDAIGVRIRELPITPDKIIDALAAKEGRRRRHRVWRRPSRWWVAGIRALYPRGLHHVLHTWGTRLGHPVGSAEPGPVGAGRIEAPDDLAEVLQQVGAGAQVVGGMTDAVVERQAERRPSSVLVSIRRIRELNAITSTEDGSLVIGAAATLSELGAATRDSVPVLTAVVESIASAQVRNVATVGGNLAQEKRCWFFRNDFACFKRSGPTNPCYAITGDHRFQHAVIDAHRCQAVTPSDLATVLVALDADAGIMSDRGTRTVSVADLFIGPGELDLAEDELVGSIIVPPAARGRSTVFRKLNLYTGDFATASAVLSVDRDRSGRWRDLRLVLGAMAPVPWRARSSEDSVRGTTPSAASLRSALDRELDRAAHPLPHNGWKLDAAAGLVEHLVDDLAAIPLR